MWTALRNKLRIIPLCISNHVLRATVSVQLPLWAGANYVAIFKILVVDMEYNGV